MRSRLAVTGAMFYFLLFASAYAYTFFDHRTFAGLAAVLLGLPWIDYLPSEWFLAAIALNTAIIYLLLAVAASLYSLLRRRRAPQTARRNTNSVSS
jgi:ABC-type lipoprotein release transport system permease subunit